MRDAFAITSSITRLLAVGLKEDVCVTAETYALIYSNIHIESVRASLNRAEFSGAVYEVLASRKQSA